MSCESERGAAPKPTPCGLSGAYGGDGARVWNEVVSDPGYDLGRRERAALERACDAFAADLSGGLRAFFQLGSGTGIELPIIAKRLPQPREWTLVDVSEELLQQAIAVGRSLLAETGWKEIRADLRHLDLQERLRAAAASADSACLVLLVGNGVLAVEADLLPRLSRAMRPEDRLLFTVEMQSPDQPTRPIASYSIAPIARLIERALERAGHAGREVSLRLDGDLLVAGFEAPSGFEPMVRSLRPRAGSVGRVLEDAGLRVVRLDEYADLGCAAALCAPG